VKRYPRKPLAAAYVAVPPLHALSRASRPSSNTGLTSKRRVAEKVALCVDYCTLVFPDTAAELFELSPNAAVEWLFPGCGFTCSPHQLKTWQFYPMSSCIYGPDGVLVGRVGSGGNGGTTCVSLSGAGCHFVNDWMCTVIQSRRLRAHISRVDVAFDDFEAQHFPTIRDVCQWAKDGLFNALGIGKKSATRFMDDHDSGKGSTVYVGGRGRKQLCIYEKGKQLGDPTSRWIRCELRLWAADVIIPLDVLTNPGSYLKGAYSLLAEKLPELSTELAKPERVHRAVKATADAAVRFMRQQCGPTLDLLIRSLGPDVWTLLEDRVLRSTVPRRFRGLARDLTELRGIVRDQLSSPVAA
jgi:phage replication initiation protein